MQTLDTKRAIANGHIQARRRRPPDAFQWGFALLLLLGFVASAALATAITVGSVWLAIVAVQDIMRRLGG